MAVMQVPTNYLEPLGDETLGEESFNIPSSLCPSSLYSSSSVEKVSDTEHHDENEDKDARKETEVEDAMHEMATEDPENKGAPQDHKHKKEVVDEKEGNACWASYGRRGPVHRFPPAIPLLARTGNLWGHMPWVLKRIYKDDGSLVIQEVRVKHHEYFRTRRFDQRLTLQLMHIGVLAEGKKGMTAVVHSEVETSSSSLLSLSEA